MAENESSYTHEIQDDSEIMQERLAISHFPLTLLFTLALCPWLTKRARNYPHSELHFETRMPRHPHASHQNPNIDLQGMSHFICILGSFWENADTRKQESLISSPSFIFHNAP